MKRRPKQVLQEENPALVASDGDPLVQIKVWLLGVSPMVWRRLLDSAPRVPRRAPRGVSLMSRWMQRRPHSPMHSTARSYE